MKLAKQLLMAATVVVATPASAQVPGTGPLQQTTGSTHYDDCCSTPNNLGPNTQVDNPSIDKTQQTNATSISGGAGGNAGTIEIELTKEQKQVCRISTPSISTPSISTQFGGLSFGETYNSKSIGDVENRIERMCKVAIASIDPNGTKAFGEIPAQCNKQKPTGLNLDR